MTEPQDKIITLDDEFCRILEAWEILSEEDRIKTVKLLLTENLEVFIDYRSNKVKYLIFKLLINKEPLVFSKIGFFGLSRYNTNDFYSYLSNNMTEDDESKFVSFCDGYYWSGSQYTELLKLNKQKITKFCSSKLIDMIKSSKSSYFDRLPLLYKLINDKHISVSKASVIIGQIAKDMGHKWIVKDFIAKYPESKKFIILI